MPTISLSVFFDFVSATGTQRIALVRKLKNRTVYDPKEDYYKQFRDAVQLFHGQSTDKNAFFKQFLGSGIHEKKYQNLKRMCDGYKKFLGKKAVRATPRQTYKWTHKDLTVKLSPIFHLSIEGKNHVIKAHLSKNSLSRSNNKLAVVLHLMRNATPAIPVSTAVAVLDVGNSKIYLEGNPDPDMHYLLQSEADAFLTLYNSIN